MSAVCALYRFHGRPIDEAAIERMLRAMDGWGAGPAGCWIDGAGGAGLGCRLMRVTPEDEFDRQPVHAADGSAILVADARIDNRPELAAELGIATSEAACLPDSAFILAAWAEWGEDCASRLIGDFAFVIHDTRSDRLYAARDPLGQRVLFLHRNAERLAIASAIPALLELPDVAARLNEQKVAQLLVLIEDAATTCFEGITRLLPGHSLTASADGVGQKPYWSPDPDRSTVLASDAEYLEAFRAVFRRAVKDRLRSSRPVAVMVSAGLDSSSVAAMAADALRETGGRLLAFHSAPHDRFDGAARSGWVNDESAEVRALAEMHPNMELTVLRGQDRTPLDDADRLFEMLQAPVRNSINLSWYRQIYETAAARGAGVMLNGGKGNLTISHTGLGSITDAARRGRVVSAFREARAVAAARGRRPRDVIRDQILIPLTPLPVLRLYARLRGGRPAPVWETSCSAISPDFARSAHVDELLRERGEDDASLERLSSAGYRYGVLRLGAESFDFPHSMRSWFPIETREVPTDMRLVEFCLGIPGSQYLRDGRDRLLIRRSMRNLVPDVILERTTRGAQAADWPHWFGRMRPAMAAELDALRDVDLARRSLDLDRMRDLVNRWPRQLGPEHLEDYALLLLRGVMMGRFIRWFERRWG